MKMNESTNLKQMQPQWDMKILELRYRNLVMAFAHAQEIIKIKLT